MFFHSSNGLLFTCHALQITLQLSFLIPATQTQFTGVQTCLAYEMLQRADHTEILALETQYNGKEHAADYQRRIISATKRREAPTITLGSNMDLGTIRNS